MFNHFSKTQRGGPTRLLQAAYPLWLVLALFCGVGMTLARPHLVAATSAAEVSDAQKKDAPPQLSSEHARKSLEQTNDGQSLMRGLTAARFAQQGSNPTLGQQDKVTERGRASSRVLAQPANTINVRVRYSKEYGYRGDTSAFGNVGPRLCP